MIEGQCNCGAVAFRVDAEVTDVYVCHCSICRRWTGTNGVAAVIVEKAQFEWVRGHSEIGAWRKPDADWESWFCRTCGSALPGENDDSRMFVPAGLITVGSEALTVKHHIWVQSRAAWDEIGGAGQQHPEAFGSGD